MASHQHLSKTLNIASWICQSLLALTLAWAAGMKLFQPIEQLAQMWPWTGQHPTLTRVAGIIDLAGALGIVLPAALRIRPVLSLYAAYGIIALMIAAIVFHVSRGEASAIGFNIFMLVITGFVAWARKQ